MAEQGVAGVYVPETFPELSTRKVLVTEWIDGIKLSQCEPSEIKELIALGQEAFLVQVRLKRRYGLGRPREGWRQA
jgi:predicted unusual protein kinase regulating ubiquinone biosynthesis (AarF/ABC1/UbiB family)